MLFKRRSGEQGSARPTAKVKPSRARELVGQVGPWPGRHRAGTTAFLVAIVAGVLCGPAALVVTAANSRLAPELPPATPSQNRPSALVGQEQIAAQGVAVQLVGVWLTAANNDTDRAALAELVGELPDGLVLPDTKPAPPTGLVVTAITQTAEHTFSVRVVARGGVAGRASAFEVAVDTSGGLAAAAGLPAQIGLPAHPRPDANSNDPVTDTHPAAIAAAGWTASWLTGAGDIARWMPPQATPNPPLKACAKAQIVGVTGPQDLPGTPPDMATSQLVVTVTCTVDKKISRTLQYPLTLVGRGGRWEVTGITNGGTDTSATPNPATPTS